MEITVQAAMNELKLIEKKIEKALTTQFVGVSVGQKPVQNYKTNDEFSEKSKAAFQQIRDLIARRSEIKSAIVASNAVTKIRVNGIEMTVADALERKGNSNDPSKRSWIYFQRALLSKLVKDQANANSFIERESAKLEQEISQKADILLGKDSVKSDPSQIEEIRKMLQAQKSPKLIDPISVQSLIDELTEEIEEFESKIDAAISESNATTRITISGSETNSK